MPLTTETTEDCMGIVHVGTGTVTGEEIVAASEAALRLVQNTRNFLYEFVDLSDAAAVQMSEENLAQITAQDQLAAVFRPNAVIVIVAPRDDAFSIAKRWEDRVHGLGWSTHVDRDRAAALNWLHKNFPPPPVDKLAADIRAASARERSS